MDVKRAGRGHERELIGGKEGVRGGVRGCQEGPEISSVIHTQSKVTMGSSFIVARDDNWSMRGSLEGVRGNERG